MRTYLYFQNTGNFFLPDGSFLCNCYAGRDIGLNNPDKENLKGIGPLPTGLWMICPPINHDILGPFALPLARENIPYGRASFYIHGDNKAMNKTASHGCVIMARAFRERVSRNLAVKPLSLPNSPLYLPSMLYNYLTVAAVEPKKAGA